VVVDNLVLRGRHVERERECHAGAEAIEDEALHGARVGADLDPGRATRRLAVEDDLRVAAPAGAARALAATSSAATPLVETRRGRRGIAAFFRRGTLVQSYHFAGGSVNTQLRNTDEH
jgi:hypothetical protein